MNIHIIEPLAVSEKAMREFKERFLSAGHKVMIFPDRNENTNEIIKRSKGADIVVIGNLPFPKEVVQALPDLKMLAVAFTGLDHVAVKTCSERGITVMNSAGYSTVSVAELTVGLIIDLLRNVTRLDSVTRKGGTRNGYAGFDLSGKTVGIIGTGAIGLYLAKLLSGFGINLLGYSRTKRPEAKMYGITYTSLETLLKESDIVSIHLPLTDNTRGLMDSGKIGLMKKNAFIVNCARGPIINSADLADALKTRTIAGAALDVFDTEPPLNQDNLLLNMDNVILTPHIAYATEEAFLRRLEIVEKNINSFISSHL